MGNLAIDEVLALLPKTIGTVKKAVAAAEAVKAQGTVSAKSIGEAAGVVADSALGSLLDLIDDIIAAAKS